MTNADILDAAEKLSSVCDVDNFGCGWDVEEYYKG